MSPLSDIRSRLEAATDRSVKVYELVCVLCFFVMILIALIQIGNRHVPIPHPWDLGWTDAWAVRFMLFVAFLSIGLVHIHEEDITISTFREWVSNNTPQRAGASYAFLINATVLGMLGFLVFVTYNQMMASWTVGTTPNYFTWFTQGHMYLFLFVGLTAAFLYRLFKTVRTVYIVSEPVFDRTRSVLRDRW